MADNQQESHEPGPVGVHSYLHRASPGPIRPYLKSVPVEQLANETWSVPAICAAYQWPTGLAGGGTIAIVELGGGWTQADIDKYFAGINQPVPKITDVSVDGATNSPNQHIGSAEDPDGEVLLDIEVAAAAYYVATAKPANIRMYWSQDIAKAVLAAAKDGCDVCSISWGAGQRPIGARPLEMKWNKRRKRQQRLARWCLQRAATIISADGGPTPANVDLPASAPHVGWMRGNEKDRRR